MRNWCVALLLGVVACLVHFVLLVDLVKTLPAPVNHNGCALHFDETNLGSEDMQLYDEGRILITSGDFLVSLFGGYPEKGKMGEIALLDVRGDVPVRTVLPVAGLPSTITFLPHGMFYSNSTSLLYVINHGFSGGGTRILIIKVSDNSGMPSLSYVRSVEHSEFRPGVLNDVVEGRQAGELYVSEWLMFPLPVKGKKHPESLWDTLAMLFQKVVPGFTRSTRVLRCTFDPTGSEAATCTSALDGFRGANGLATTPDRSTIFISDPGTHSVTIAELSDGKATVRSRVDMETAIDNLEYDPVSGNIVGGGIPAIYQSLMYMDGHDVNILGSAVVLAPTGTKWEYEVSEPVVVDRDSTGLGMISVCVFTNGKAIFGSPPGPGLLVCNL